MPEGRLAVDYDHRYDGRLYYLGLALDPAYFASFVEGCLKRVGEDGPYEEYLLRGIW